MLSTAVIQSRIRRVIVTSFTRCIPRSGIIGGFEALVAADGYRIAGEGNACPQVGTAQLVIRRPQVFVAGESRWQASQGVCVRSYHGSCDMGSAHSGCGWSGVRRNRPVLVALPGRSRGPSAGADQAA